MHKVSRSLGQQKVNLRRIFITDSVRGPNPLITVRRLLPSDMVIIRDYDHPHRAELARKIVSYCKQKQVVCLVAGDVQLARSIGADGLHLAEWQLTNPPPLQGFKIVTAACHSLKALHRAASLNVDAALISSVYPTESNAEKVAIGPQGLLPFIKHPKRPDIFALGGITEKNLKLLARIPLAGYAGVSFFRP